MLKLTALIISAVFLLPACDPIGDIASWITDFYNTYLADIGCWLLSALFSMISVAGDVIVGILTPIIALLPVVTLPTVDLSGSTVLGYTAYFFPVSETALLIKALIGFYTTFFVGRIILRWLKVLK